MYVVFCGVKKPYLEHCSPGWLFQGLTNYPFLEGLKKRDSIFYRNFKKLVIHQQKGCPLGSLGELNTRFTSVLWNPWSHSLLRWTFGQRKRPSKMKSLLPEYGPHAWRFFAMWWAPYWWSSWDNSHIRHLAHSINYDYMLLYIGMKPWPCNQL